MLSTYKTVGGGASLLHTPEWGGGVCFTPLNGYRNMCYAHTYVAFIIVIGTTTYSHTVLNTVYAYCVCTVYVCNVRPKVVLRIRAFLTDPDHVFQNLPIWMRIWILFEP